MKKWKIALVVGCVLILITAVYAATAAVGSQQDPLVTLSYLENIFKPQMENAAKQAASDRQAELEKALNDLINSQGGGSSDGAVFKVVTLSKGQTLTGDVGCEIMLRVGTATVSNDNPGLIDTTAGTTLNNGASLVTNHLYMVTISTRTVTATANTTKLLVRGPYTIK